MKIPIIGLFGQGVKIQKQDFNLNGRFNNYNNFLVRSPQADSVSFAAKIPCISAPTLEDLINKTKAVDVLRYNVLRLAKYDIPCPVCGRKMLSVDAFNKFEAKVLDTTDTGKLLEYIGSLKRYLHPVEAKIYGMFKAIHKNKPNMSIHGMLKYKLPEAENMLVHEQSKVFTNMGLLSRDLPNEKRIKVQELINEGYSRIMDPRETSRFSRRVFIDKLKNIFVPAELRQVDDIFGSIYSESELAIIEEATKLPTAYNNVNAFIVKYAKRDYKGANPNQKIATRMLSNSLATVEHITAKKLNGETCPKNLALECACDNNRRGHSSIIEQIAENPKMIDNYKKYIRRLCEIHNAGKVEKAYIKQQNNSFKSASYGILNADTEMSILHWDGPKESVSKLKRIEAETVEKKEVKKPKRKQQSRKSENNSRRRSYGKRR